MGFRRRSRSSWCPARPAGPLRLDFAWPEHRVALEHAGLWHGEPGQFAKDRRRLDQLGDAGWRIVFATAVDVHRPAELIARLASLLAA